MAVTLPTPPALPALRSPDGTARLGVVTDATAVVYFENPKARELPSLFTSPVEGVDSAEKPWVNEQMAMQIKIRAGLMRPPMTPPPAGPTASPPGPAMGGDRAPGR